MSHMRPNALSDRDYAGPGESDTFRRLRAKYACPSCHAEHWPNLVCTHIGVLFMEYRCPDCGHTWRMTQ